MSATTALLVPATAVSARQVLAVRLARSGAWLWTAAGVYGLALRPRFASTLPPRDQWGSEESTAHVFDLAANGFVIVAIVATTVWSVAFWAVTARLLRRGSGAARGLAVGTALVTGLTAVRGVGMLFGPLDGARALAVLLPLLAVSTVALPAFLRLPRQH
ncbi:hypothetical protein [Kitasatospora sp. NPDC101183]|uniref:hypothetical protein n=1 Tax=Kitasatospora sp. NPDC101183 TaxID=3364100 RepID=UPI00381627BF